MLISHLKRVPLRSLGTELPPTNQVHKSNNNEHALLRIWGGLVPMHHPLFFSFVQFQRSDLRHWQRKGAIWRHQMAMISRRPRLHGVASLRLDGMQ